MYDEGFADLAEIRRPAGCAACLAPVCDPFESGAVANLKEYLKEYLKRSSLAFDLALIFKTLLKRGNRKVSL